jgi:hypothetical protein
MYAASCERFGVDPAAVLDEDDDVIALNFRSALLYGLNSEVPTEDDSKLSDDELLRSLRALEARN